MTDNSRNLALAFWRRSKEFLEAANLVAEAAGDRASLPAYYLWGHSIELSLKVFLIGNGIPLRELKSRDLGHNLAALWQKARSLGFEREIHLYPKEIGTILLLSQDYSEKKFEYAEAERYRLPFIHLTKRTAGRLVLLLNPNRKVTLARAQET
jgi:HEPN domain-containing protein